MARTLWVASIGLAGFGATSTVSTPEIEGDTLENWGLRLRLEQAPGVDVKMISARLMTADEERRWELFWPKYRKGGRLSQLENKKTQAE